MHKGQQTVNEYVSKLKNQKLFVYLYLYLLNALCGVIYIYNFGESSIVTKI